jgi:positive phototaxis protein PixI
MQRLENLDLDEIELAQDQVEGEPYLECHLDHNYGHLHQKTNIAIVPMAVVQEVLIVRSKNIVPVPNMSSSVLGLVSSHSRVYWTVDIAQMLGLSALQVNTHHYSVAILKTERLSLAIAAIEIKGVVKFTPEQIKPLAASPAKTIPYLKGCIVNGEISYHLVDVEVMMNSPILRS